MRAWERDSRQRGPFHAPGDGGKSRWLGTKEPVLEKGQMLWAERGRMGRGELWGPEAGKTEPTRKRTLDKLALEGASLSKDWMELFREPRVGSRPSQRR